MIFKYIVLLFRTINIYYYRLYNRLIFKEQRIIFSEMPLINGKVIIKNFGTIKMGKNVSINNTSHFNPIGLPHPTIFCTQGKNAIIEIGDNVGISGSSIVSSTSIKIGNNVLIGGGVGIWDTDFHPLDPEMRRINRSKGAKTIPIIIEDDVFIGARSLILKGVTIGKGSVIGAGSIITKNVPAGHLVVGHNKLIDINKEKSEDDKSEQ